MKDNIKVFLRLKNDTIHTQNTFYLNKEYKFDQVFHLPNAAMYNVVGRPYVNSFLCGYNITLMAYGQTNSGKTFSIQGSQEDSGLLQRILFDVYQKVSSRDVVSISYVEIYNEEIFDLFGDHFSSKSGKCQQSLQDILDFDFSDFQKQTKDSSTSTKATILESEAGEDNLNISNFRKQKRDLNSLKKTLKRQSENDQDNSNLRKQTKDLNTLSKTLERQSENDQDNSNLRKQTKDLNTLSNTLERSSENDQDNFNLRKHTEDTNTSSKTLERQSENDDDNFDIPNFSRETKITNTSTKSIILESENHQDYLSLAIERKKASNLCHLNIIRSEDTQHENVKNIDSQPLLHPNPDSKTSFQNTVIFKRFREKNTQNKVFFKNHQISKKDSQKTKTPINSRTEYNSSILELPSMCSYDNTDLNLYPKKTNFAFLNKKKDINIQKKIEKKITKNRKKGGEITIREDINNNIYLHNCTIIQPKSFEHSLELFQTATINRRISATQKNEQSSRSHAVFTIYLHSKGVVHRSSKFHIIDLAGSEKVGAQKNTLSLHKTNDSGDKRFSGVRNKTSEDNTLLTNKIDKTDDSDRIKFLGQQITASEENEFLPDKNDKTDVSARKRFSGQRTTAFDENRSFLKANNKSSDSGKMKFSGNEIRPVDQIKFLEVKDTHKQESFKIPRNSSNHNQSYSTKDIGQKQTIKDQQRIFNETCCINKSLLILGTVIEKLSNNEPFINYRDSKLTHLLKDCLSGNSKILLLGTIDYIHTQSETNTNKGFNDTFLCLGNESCLLEQQIFTSTDNISSKEESRTKKLNLPKNSTAHTSTNENSLKGDALTKKLKLSENSTAHNSTNGSFLKGDASTKKLKLSENSTAHNSTNENPLKGDASTKKLKLSENSTAHTSKDTDSLTEEYRNKTIKSSRNSTYYTSTNERDNLLQYENIIFSENKHSNTSKLPITIDTDISFKKDLIDRTDFVIFKKSKHKNFYETLNTLNFLQKATKIEINPQLNTTIDGNVEDLKNELKEIYTKYNILKLQNCQKPILETKINVSEVNLIIQNLQKQLKDVKVLLHTFNSMVSEHVCSNEQLISQKLCEMDAIIKDCQDQRKRRIKDIILSVEESRRLG